MGLDTSGLDSRIFEGFADTSKRRYLYACNMKTGISRWSKNAVEYFGLPGEYMEDAGTIWAEHIHSEDRGKYIEDIKNVFEGKRDTHSMDYRARNRDGEYVVCTCQGKVQKGKDGEADLFLGTIENHGIMDNVDATTNLYNIYEFWRYMKKAKEEKKDSYLLVLGVNNFSEVNDVYGYAFGDKVLREVASKLYTLVRREGYIFRLDGVRFACCFENKTVEEIEDLYEKIRREMRHNIFVEGIRVAVYISGGAVHSNGEFDEYSVQSSGRYAFEQSKHENHGDLVLFDKDSLINNKKNLELMDALRKSLLDGYKGFYLCYQPIFSAEKEEMIGAEALLRWRNEQMGEVPPGIFIPWLEHDPRFFDLGNWILKRACTEAKPFVEKYPDFVLNVNIAYTQLCRISFRDAVKEILEETGFPAQNLCLELTERCRQLEKNYLNREVTYLKSLGIKIAIDDFGTGFSSLNLLSELPDDTLKIDRAFVRDIEGNKANQSIVRAVTDCANDLNVHVCLEGLEDRKMIDFTKRFDVYSYQGFYFSRPISLEAFTEKYL